MSEALAIKTTSLKRLVICEAVPLVGAQCARGAKKFQGHSAKAQFVAAVEVRTFLSWMCSAFFNTQILEKKHVISCDFGFCKKY